MHFQYACVWDKGDFYAINQDSFSLQILYTGIGPYAMAVICDGVGGLYRGEFAGGYATQKMTEWFYEMALPILCEGQSFLVLRRSCIRELKEIHEHLYIEGHKKQEPMATTFTMLILTSKQYYVFHIGDCHCYKIGGKAKSLVPIQTNRKGELTGALGVGVFPKPEFRKGRYSMKNRFLLCSDGYAGCLTTRGIQSLGDRRLISGNEEMERLMKEILKRGRKKGEKDNCTGIVIGRI